MKPHKTKTALRCAIVAALGVALAGCGGKEDAGGARPESESRTTTAAKPKDDAAATKPADKPAAGESPPAEGWGKLVGRFVYDGEAPTPKKVPIDKDPQYCGKFDLVDESLLVGEGGGLKNVVVFVRDKDVKVHPHLASKGDEEVIFANKDCRFDPHVLPILVGQTMLITNDDPVAHNTNISPIGDAAINPLIAPNATVTHKFTRAQSLGQPAACNIHTWMKGYVVPRDNPYFVVTGDDGSFEIDKLPAGELEFQVWHEKSGYLEAKPDWKRGRVTMTIQPGENDLGEIAVAPALMEKK